MSLKKTSISRRGQKQNGFQRKIYLEVKNHSMQAHSIGKISEPNRSFDLYEEILAGLSWSA